MIKLNFILSPLFFLFIVVQSCNKEHDSPQKTTYKKEGRIGVRTTANGKREFYDFASNELFIPMGYNYTHVQEFIWNNKRLSGHSTFNENQYDAEESELMLSKLEEAGYNTVRIFLNPISISSVNNQLNSSYISNLNHFISRAKKHHIGIIITTDMIPISAYNTELQSENDIWWWNHQYIFEDEIQLEVDFWNQLIEALKSLDTPLDVIISYEIRNEFFFHPEHVPFNDNSLSIEHPNSKTYDLNDSIIRNVFMNDCFLYWSSSIRNAILEKDAEALVSVGFYAPEPLGNVALLAIQKSELDFIDLHLYPETAKAYDYNSYFNLLQNSNKLIIMGEFGIVNGDASLGKSNKQVLLDWRDTFTTTFGMDGWIIWTYPTSNGSSLSIPDNDGKIFNAFSPNQ